MKNFAKDFPLLSRKYQKKPIIYFDAAATALKPQAVLDAVLDYYTNHGANIHRGPNFLAEEATSLYEQARQEVADFINASSQEVVFTAGATASFNLLARSWGESQLKAGDVIALSVAEHHANLVPWLQLKEKLGVELVYIEIDEAGNFEPASLGRALSQPRLKLLSLTQASNVLGRLYDLSPIISQAKSRGALTIVDASQSIVHTKVDVKSLGCDFLIFSGHKLYGPTGAGVLYGRQDLLAGLPPFMGGGQMIAQVKQQSFIPAESPLKFEAGTPDIAAVIGLGEAIRYLRGVGIDDIYQREQELSRYFWQSAQKRPFVHLLGGTDDRLPIFSFSLQGMHPHDAADLLGEQGIVTRAGHHCTQPLHDYLGVPASLRISLGFYNSESEIDYFWRVLEEIHSHFVN